MKEIIIAEIVSQPQQHAEKWETQMEHEGFESWLYLSKNWPSGKVKITIQHEGNPIDCDEWPYCTYCADGDKCYPDEEE